MTEPDQTEFDILAIADGVTEDGHLRISLSVSPNAFTSTGTVGDFPKHARSHVSTISIEIAKGLEVVHSFPSDAISVTRTTDGEGPSTLWKKIFPDAEALCNALKPDQKPPRKDGSEVRSPFVPTVLFSELTKQRLLAPQATSRPAIGSPGPLHKSLIADLAASDAEMLPGGSSSGQSIAQTLTPNTVAALLAKGRKSLARNDKDAFEEELAVGSAAALRALLQALGMPNGRLPQKTSAPDEEETPEGRAKRFLTACASYPTLAAYLGLAIDLTIAPPDTLSSGEYAIKLAGKRFPVRYDKERKLFLPLSSSSADISNVPSNPSPIRDGVIDLTTSLEEGDRRFGLSMIDGTNHVLAQEYLLSSVNSQRAQGTPSDALTDQMADASEAGIVLHDLQRQADYEAEQGDDDVDVFHAEDLLRGLRVDCRLVSEGEGPDLFPHRRWRPLFGRHITYTSDVARDLEAWAEGQKATSHRDEGFSQPGEVTNGAFSHVPLEVIQWSGESLGLPPPRPDEMGDEAAGDRAADIPVDRVLSPPSAREQRPPPLRFGRTYHIGARPCYVNGCGPTIEQVRSSELYERKYLEILYQRVGRVRPPTVLLPTDCRLFTANAPPPGETPTRLVVKSIVEGQATEYRVVVPGSVAFETAEQYGQFDDRVGITEDIPSGAFNRRKPWLLMNETGGFPVALGAGRRRLSRKPVDGDPEADVRPGKPSRGLVAEFRQTDKNTRFYPDSRARLLHFTATLDMTSQALGDRVENLQFWDEKSRPRDAKPVVIRAVAARRRDTELVKIKNGRKSAHDADAPGLHSWDFHLQPATRVMVDLYCSPTGSPDEDLMGFVKAGKVLNPAAQSVTRIELVHAVRRPLEAPQIPKQTDLAVFISSGAGEIEKNIENGTTAFFEGKCKIHGRSTGRLRFDARWEEHGPEYLGRKDGKWLYRPADRKDLLFRDDRVRQAGDEYLIQAKAASYSFQDGRARRLDIDVVATSAFTEFYEPSDKPDAFETRSAKPHSLVVPCSFAPPEPDHERALPVPRWRSWRNTAGTRFRVELKWAIRVFFGSNYKATGFGEQIALVLESGNDHPTQWGDDPIDGTGGLPSATPCIKDFEAAIEAPGTISGGNTKLKALLYDPTVDQDDGPCIDIAMSMLPTFRPFLKLGLCRYQPDSIKPEWTLSPCKPRWVSVPPWRKVEVTVKGRKVTVTVKGPTYADRVGKVGWKTPKLRVRVFKLQFEQWQGVPWKDPPLVPVMVTRNDNSRIPLASEVAPVSNSYHLELELPKSLNQERYVLLLEEREFFVGDPTVSAEAWPLETVVEKDGDSPIVGRVIFQRTINLGRRTDPLPEADFDTALGKEDW